jgi:transcriptional regulator with XRE-family HTH domain
LALKDKTHIINKLKRNFNISTDKQFADRLGITPQVLYNWKKRNTLDVNMIYAKFDNLNYDWLLTGKGEMFKEDIMNESEPIYKNGNGNKFYELPDGRFRIEVPKVPFPAYASFVEVFEDEYKTSESFEKNLFYSR